MEKRLIQSLLLIAFGQLFLDSESVTLGVVLTGIGWSMAAISSFIYIIEN